MSSDQGRAITPLIAGTPSKENTARVKRGNSATRLSEELLNVICQVICSVVPYVRGAPQRQSRVGTFQPGFSVRMPGYQPLWSKCDVW